MAMRVTLQGLGRVVANLALTGCCMQCYNPLMRPVPSACSAIYNSPSALCAFICCQSIHSLASPIC